MRRPKLDEFCRSYAETALWSSTDNADESGGEPLDANYDVSDIDTSTLREMVKDCISFRRSERQGLVESGLSLSRQGHNFWLDRNRHGAGFWDEGLGLLGEHLSKATKPYGSYDLYVGDDGKIHGQ